MISETGIRSDLIDTIFSSEGWLVRTLGLEHRPQQEVMAGAVWRSLNENKSLLFEAGTGVGKSLAYLIPGILFAMREKRPFIVSTHTKALQEQIQNNDLGCCRELFGLVKELEEFRDFRTAVLMGRSNYLCTTRLAHVISARGELFVTEEQKELERIVEWSMVTETGVVEELSPMPSMEIWEMVNADSSTCNSKNCSGEECFYQRAKARVRKANLIILNHSLLFSLLNSSHPSDERGSGILFPEDFLVLDEAHTVADIATDHFGVHISSYGVERVLKALYNPRSRKGLLARFGRQSDCTLVVQVLGVAEEFFNDIRQRHLRERENKRLLEGGWIEGIIFEPLKVLIDRLAILITEHNSEVIRDNLRDQYDKLMSYYLGMQKALMLEPKDHVHWVEKGGRAGQLTAIRTAPIDVASYLESVIFNRNTSAILTSATLATDNHLDNFRMKVGAIGVEGCIENSPFDYEKIVQIYISKDGPEPLKENLDFFRKYLVEQVLEGVSKTEGGTLVLCTNYLDMYSLANGVDPGLMRMKRRLFVQGRDLSRVQIIEAFKAVGNGVLLGTDSYWTGIDVPGPALSHLMITRIPFENPSHPIKQAQFEWLQKEGKSPFIYQTLPEAIIKFRQGLGRLIRKKSDSGLITILDSRILKKAYGKNFIAVLPKRGFEVLEEVDLSV